MTSLHPDGSALRLSVVVPCFNEQDALPGTHRRLVEALDRDKTIDLEIVYVDDGSTDQTADRLSALADADDRVVVVSLTRNFGHQAAVTAGLHAADGDAVAVIDADLQDPPEVILEMIDRLRAGYDVVYGVRTRREAGWARGAAYRLFYRGVRALANVDVPLDSGDFALMTRRAVDALNALPERNRYTRGLRAWIGMRQTGVPYERPARTSGASKYTTATLFRLALDGMVSMSSTPLAIVFGVGVVSALLSSASFVFYLLWWLSDVKIFGHAPADVPGFTSIVLLMFLFGSIQLISIGVIGQYVGRIYDEAKHRPIYVISHMRGRRRRGDRP